MFCIWDAYKRERVRNGLASSADLFGLFAREEDITGTFRLDYEYEIEYECEFRISNQ